MKVAMMMTILVPGMETLGVQELALLLMDVVAEGHREGSHLKVD
tara:strand:- start:780 stop:911 length:132 start_codon:yes stop_codon:yes gene_type:complete